MKKLIFLQVLLCIALWGRAQPFYTSGTHFITIYPETLIYDEIFESCYLNDTSAVYIEILSEHNTCVYINKPYLFKDSLVNVSKNFSRKVRLKNNRPKYKFETIVNRGIEIKSLYPINVIVHVETGNGRDTLNQVQRTEALTLSPKNEKNEFILSGSGSEYRNVYYEHHSLLSIVSFEDNNKLQLVLNTNSYKNGIDFQNDIVSIKKDSIVNLELSHLELIDIYQAGIHADSILDNGANIKSINKKEFSVYTTNYRPITFMEPFADPICSIIFEQPKPQAYFGTNFHIAPLQKQIGNLYSFMAIRDSTVVKFNGQTYWMLDSLETKDTCLSGEKVITSNYPLGGFLTNCPSVKENDNTVSPFTVTTTSDNELITRSIFTTLTEPDTSNHYVVGLVCKTADIGSNLLDGLPLSGVNFTAFTADPIWSWANFEVDTGFHVLENAGGFHAIHYTWHLGDTIPTGEYGSYSYPAYGYNLPESTLLPQDSFYFNVLPPQGSWQYFQDYDTTICTGDLLTFKPNIARFTTWHWNFGDGTDTLQKVDYEAPGTVAHSYSQPGLYWVVVQDSAGCTTGDSVLIEVVDGPTVQFSHTATQSCEGVWVQLQNQTQGANSYLWQFPNGETSAQENPGFFYEGNNPVTVNLTASNSQCSQSESQTFTPQVQNFNANEIPNVFTPNADGENDCYSIPNTLGFAECYQLNIYNRWGGEVFSSKDPSQCWGGDDLPDGVYFYTLNVGKETYQGEVHVLR